MKILNLTFLLFFISLSVVGQDNSKIIRLIAKNAKKDTTWINSKLSSLSIDEKLGMYLVLDGRKRSLSENAALINKYKPAAILEKIRSLYTFANAVNFYTASGSGIMVAVDSKDQIGIPVPEAVKYPDFTTLGAVFPLSKLVYLGNDLAEQMQRIGADIMFTNTTKAQEHKVVTQKLETFQKGLWFKKRYLFYYQSDDPAISSRFLTADDFKKEDRLFMVTDNISEAFAKVKSAYNYGQITDEELNEHTRNVLQLKKQLGSYEKPTINQKLIAEDISQRKYEYRRNEIEATAITLVRNPEQMVPLVFKSSVNTFDLKMASIAFGTNQTTDFQKYVKRYNNTKDYQFSYKDTISQFYNIEEEINDRHIVFFEIFPEKGKKLPESWGTFIEKLNHTKKIVVIIYGGPDYLPQLKKLPTYLSVILAYNQNKNISKSVAEIIFGEREIYGVLPYSAGFPYKENDRSEVKAAKRYIPYSSQLPPKRELRAAWIATVLNIDWPSKASLSESEERTEFIKILDKHKANNLNAVICQISPSADAFFPSDKLAWSQWLTGKSGLEPKEFYDPLKFMIDECHKRNMEFHAWFNPYRVKVNLKYEMSHDHASKRYPELMLTYGNKMYFDPGYEKTRKVVTEAVMEVINNYDIDGVHFDDYFYPYKIRGKEFPDTLSFEKERRGFADNQKDDWRRENVNLIIKMLHDNIKAEKPWVKFGISPFGVWRNKINDVSGSDTKAGVTNYDGLYADIMLWMKNGWIDYIMPQVYWHIGKEVADFEKIVNWWSKNTHGLPVYIGHGIYRLDNNSKTKAWRDVGEIPTQIKLIRSYPEIEGSAFFSTKTFFKNPMGINEVLKKDVYKYPALIPKMPLIDNEAPEKPANIDAKRLKGYKKRIITWENDTTLGELDKVKYYMVYKFEGDEPGDISTPVNFYKQINKPELIEDFVNGWLRRKKFTFVITAFDRLHNESKASVITVRL